MVSKELTVNYEKGIHARPASVIVETTKRFTSEIFLVKDKDRANAKSIMSILYLAIECGCRIILEADGPDEKKALETVIRLFENNFQNEISR